MILEEIFRLVEVESEMDSVYRLTDDERRAINEGFNDVKEGRVYSSEAARNVIIGLRKILSEDKNLLRRLPE